MKPVNKFKKKMYRSDKYYGYYIDEDFRNPIPDFDNGIVINQTLYEKVDTLKWQRAFLLSGFAPEGQLEELKKEFNVRCSITKNEIFEMGELLMHIKKICQQERKGFQEWIENNLDVSYETANNFMNVYKCCLGQRHIALRLNPSILYKISAPSFPDELRQYLFDNETLDEMTNGKLREITKKYKSGGFEAIKDDIEELNRGHLIFKQSCHTLDLLTDALRTLEGLKEKIEKRGGPLHQVIAFENLIKTDEPEAFEINSVLYNALQSAINGLVEARNVSEDMLQKVCNAISDKCGLAEPDDRIPKKGIDKFCADHPEM